MHISQNKIKIVKYQTFDKLAVPPAPSPLIHL